MATANNRGALDAPTAAVPDEGGAAPVRRFSWLGLIGIGLSLALLAVAVLQMRQEHLVRQAVQSVDDDMVLMVYQTETDYLRLREQWSLTSRDPSLPGLGTLRLRYDIFVNRVDLLQGERPQRLVRGNAEHEGTIGRLHAFIASADSALGRNPARAVDAVFLASLLPELQRLDAPVQALARAASNRVAEQMALRNATLEQLNRIDLGLTLFLSALVMAFALVALRHVRQLRQRRAALEELATKLRLSRREAETASEAKSMFLANMSHEIRTPFHGLMGMLSLLRETGLTPRQIDYLRTATESADHLLAILNGILDMSQLESGRMTLAPAATDLRTLLRDVEALMRPQATAKSLALHLDADPLVPERVMLDATRVKQILFNLLSNAIKFSDHGAVVLDVRTGGDGSGTPGELQFVVTDHGVGMDEVVLGQLFNRFVQGDGSRSRRHGGTGLGLEISRTLARLMGGEITVRSRLGEGSSFTFHLPLQAVQDPPGARTGSLLPGAAGSRPLHVLVAEDHPVNRQYMAALLENLGHRAHFTANGEEAVAAARLQRYDIVLMDLHMPLLDGVGATRAIRALPDPQLSTVPIVALTADAFAETRERCLVAGMNDFLTKPVSPQKLATSLRRLFGAGAVPAGTASTPVSAPPPRPAPGLPVIDIAAIDMALQAMPRERLAEMIAGFLDQGPQTVQRLRTAIRDAEALELRVNAHAARGAALNLGLAALAATAEALHEGAAHLPAHEIALLVKRYEELLPLTREAVRTSGLGLDLPPPAQATAA